MNTHQKASYCQALTMYQNMIEVFIRTHDYSQKVKREMNKLKSIKKALTINAMEVIKNNPILEQNYKFKQDITECMLFLKSNVFKSDIKNYYDCMRLYKKDFAYLVISKCERFNQSSYFNIFNLNFNKTFNQLIKQLNILHQTSIIKNKKNKNFNQGDLMTRITEMTSQTEVDGLFEIVNPDDGNAYLIQFKPVKYVIDDNQTTYLYSDALIPCFYNNESSQYLYPKINYSTIYQIKIDILNNNDLTPNIFNDKQYLIPPRPAKKTEEIIPDNELEELFKPIEKCKHKCKPKNKKQPENIKPIIKTKFNEVKSKLTVFKITNPTEIIIAENTIEICTLTTHIICNAISCNEPKIKINYETKPYYLTFNHNTTFNNKKLLEKMLNDYYIKNPTFKKFMKTNAYSVINVIKDIHNSNCYTVINHFNLIFKNTTTNTLSKTFHANINNNKIYNITELNVI